MAGSSLPLPVSDEKSQPFFDGAKRHERMLKRCKSCVSYLWPVKFRCDVCLDTDIEWAKASGQEKLYSFGIMHQVYHPCFASKVPYNVANVELEEGIRIICNVMGCPSAELRVDTSLEVTFEEICDGVTIPKFKPGDRNGSGRRI